MNRTIAALALAGSVAAFTATTAGATPNHDKPSICHPVEGKGETGYGWNLISPDEASKHIDEKTGAGKHTRKDGRTDVYADAAGHCPGFVIVITPTPKPTHTTTPEPTPTETTTPTPEPTNTTPTPEPTETSSPEPTPSATETPDPTPTATVTPDPTPTVTTPTPEPSTPAATPTPSRTRAVVPVAHSTTSPPAEPATHRAELAQTGAKETANLIALGLLLLAVGVGLVTLARVIKEGAHK